MATSSLAAGKTAHDINYDELSKVELLDLWYETDKELHDTNPFTDYENWAVLQKRFDAIVRAYYRDSDGVLRLEERF